LKVFLYYIGKPKDPHSNAIAEDFVRRASHYAAMQMQQIRAENAKPEKAALPAKHPTAQRIYLDPAGRQMESEEFAQLFSKAEMAGHDLLFLVGGHDGLSPAWRAQANILLSLSRMTLPHELARAMLAEQIYRAWAILRGHPYPR